MGLPAGLTVEALKRRLDINKSSEDTLLGEYLEEAVEQAQQPYPTGCGLRLTPDPAFNEGADTAEPVSRTFVTAGQTVVLAEGARTLTAVTRTARGATETLDPSATPAGYRTVTHKGLIVALRLHHYLGCGYWGDWGGGYSGGGGCSCREHTSTVTVTGRFGLAEIPGTLRGAIYVLAARKYLERAVNYADQVNLAEGQGTEVYYRQLPPATKLAFDSWALPKGIVGYV